MNVEVLAERHYANLTAEDVMSGSVRVVDADWSVSQLAEFFVDNGISGAPVVSMERGLVGVVSHSDIVRHSTQSSDEPDQTHEYYMGLLKTTLAEEDLLGMHLDLSEQTRVSDIMTTTVFRVDVSTSVPEIAEIMTTGRIHRLFVTRQDVVVGVVAALDMIELLCNPA